MEHSLYCCAFVFVSGIDPADILETAQAQKDKVSVSPLFACE